MLGQIRQISALLKSDHFGIEIGLSLQTFTVVYGLKSDHFGIEISMNYQLFVQEVELKSDHFGIEIYNHAPKHPGE